MSARLPVLVGALLTAVLLAGCTGLPEDGPVTPVEESTGRTPARAFDLDAVSPVDGASQVDTVRGFLDAMTASPVRLDVAREYLTDDAASRWNPEAATITYGERSPERVGGGAVSVRLDDAQRVDGAGVWRGRLDPAQETLRFTVALEDGSYRIADPPNALVVPTTWYTQRFSQASLFYFDPSARVLVPQPVFVPRGEQLASALVDALATGPGPGSRDVVRTFLPRGLRVGVSVPVSSSGVALVELVGDATPLSDDERVRLLAQLAWTLRQVPGVTAVRATLGGRAVRTPSGGEEYAVSQAIAFDPLGRRASGRLFALRGGALVRLAETTPTAVGGPFADGSLGIRSVGVGIAGDRAAGVTADGSRLLVGPVGPVGQGESVPDEESTEAEVVLDDGRDLLRPSWDLFDRVWVVDTGAAGGARVRYVVGDRVRTLPVPGISGQQVTSMRVSRDGTRLVAVVRDAGDGGGDGGGAGDEVRAARVRSDAQGRILGATRATALDRQATAGQDLLDLGWTSPTTVAFLSAVVPGELFETRPLSVDGAPGSLVSQVSDARRQLSESVSAPVTGLVTSPDPDAVRYASTPTGLVDLDTGRTEEFSDPGVTWVGYVG